MLNNVHQIVIGKIQKKEEENSAIYLLDEDESAEFIVISGNIARIGLFYSTQERRDERIVELCHQLDEISYDLTNTELSYSIGGISTEEDAEDEFWFELHINTDKFYIEIAS